MSAPTRREGPGSRQRSCLAPILAGTLAAAIPALASAERPSDRPPPSCEEAGIADELDGRQERRGVQEREFLKRGRVAVSPRGGLFAADRMSSSYMYGGELRVFLTERLGVWTSAEITPIELELERPLDEFFGGARSEGELGVVGLAGVSFAPIHAKLKAGSDRVIHADLYFSAGAGRVFHRASQGVALTAGATLELFTASWLALRFDLRDVAALQGVAGETELGHNIAATGGLSFWLPSAW